MSKRHLIWSVFFVAVAVAFLSCGPGEEPTTLADSVLLDGPYMGQPAPGMTREAVELALNRAQPAVP